MLLTYPDLAPAVLERNGVAGRTKAERWVLVHVEEAYIHCSSTSRMTKVPREIAWGTDDVKRKGGDFGASRDRGERG